MAKQHALTAIIYDKKGRVLSVGQNSYVKTHPMQKMYAERLKEPYKEFLHAEIAAIIKCPDLSKAHKIAIFRFTADGEPAPSHPCIICQSAIQASGISEVSYT